MNIFKAIRNGDLGRVQELIKEWADVNAISPDGDSPLYLATESGNLEIIQELKKYGAYVYAKNLYGWTTLQLAAQSGDLEMAKELLKNGANVNAKNIYGQTPLDLAAQCGHLEMVKELIKEEADVRTEDHELSTPLHKAAHHGYLEIVQELKKSGAKLNSKDAKGSTPLCVAIESGHLKVVQEFLKNAANYYTEGYSPLTSGVAKYARKLKIIKALIAAKFDVNAKNFRKETALHHAAQSGYIKIVQELVKSGAELNVKDVKGNTPLHLAILRANKFKAAEELIKAGADVNAKNYNGDTLLHLAVEKKRDAIAILLVEYGADINIENDKGQTPMTISKGRGAELNLKKLSDHRKENIEVKRLTEFVEENRTNEKLNIEPIKTLLRHLYKKPYIEKNSPIVRVPSVVSMPGQEDSNHSKNSEILNKEPQATIHEPDTMATGVARSTSPDTSPYNMQNLSVIGGKAQNTNRNVYVSEERKQAAKKRKITGIGHKI